MKNNIAVLGPKDTFADLAAQEFLKNHPQIDATISYYKPIRKVFEDLAAGNSQIAIVPMENTLAGPVEATQKGLSDFPVEKIDEITLSIQHSFFSMVEPSKIKKIFTHNMAEKQCSKFLSKFLSAVEIIHTDSNIDSFDKLNKLSSGSPAGAVVPSHIFEENKNNYEYSVQNITDSPNNSTRFLVLRRLKLNE